MLFIPVIAKMNYYDPSEIILKFWFSDQETILIVTIIN